MNVRNSFATLSGMPIATETAGRNRLGIGQPL
jgi:hypothetical protein